MEELRLVSSISPCRQKKKKSVQIKVESTWKLTLVFLARS